MKYLKNSAVFYLSFFDKARLDGNVDIDFLSLFDGISSLYCLSSSVKKELLTYWQNEDFSEITSSKVAKFHLDFVENITAEKRLFGSVAEEREILKSKLSALEYYETLTEGGLDFISSLERSTDRRRVALTLSLLHFLKNGKIPDRLISLLKRNASAKDSCDFDALLLLLKTEKENKEQYMAVLKRSSFSFYFEDYERVVSAYSELKENFNDYSGKTG